MANKELNKRVYVHQLKEYFNFKQLSGDEESLKRWIIAPDVNRPGLELSGYTASVDLKRVVIIGNKEIDYLKQFDEETQKERFHIVTDSYTPCIVVTASGGAPKSLIEVAQSKNFPVFESEWKTYMAVQNIVAYLSHALAPETSVYGVMLDIFGVGVMITGESGIGKSELALELIKRGHTFLADDRIDISRVQNDLLCQAPALLKGMLEIRGIGIIDVAMMFGASSVGESLQLDLVINLKQYNDAFNFDRLDTDEQYTEIMGLQRPLVEIPVTPARNVAILVEVAVTDYRLHQKGINSTALFNQRVYDEIQRRNKGEQ